MDFTEADVCKTAERIWRTAVGIDLVSIDGYCSIAPGERLLSTIDFEGGFNGRVALECSRNLAATMASTMFAVEPSDLTEADISDALQEMTNITGGGLKAMTSRNTKMSLPTVVSEDQWTETASESGKAVGFECDGERLNIFISGECAASEENSVRLLLVEDSRVARRMILESLKEVKTHCFEVEWCECLADGLSKIDSTEFDVVLLDLTLKDSCGLETCVRVHERSPALPIVVLTSIDEESFAMDALKSGAQDYLLKAEVAPTLLARSIHYAMERSKAEASRAKLQQQLLDASRQAGIAEMATGILHNVGNVLNSVNLSATLIYNNLRKSMVDKLEQTSELVNQHRENFGDFVDNDERGKRLPQMIERLASRLSEERATLQHEAAELIESIEHIKEIVNAQQAVAKPSGLQVRIDLKELVEQALKTSIDDLRNSETEIDRDFQDTPIIWADQHKILQILSNLIRNAEESIRESDRATKKLTLRTGMTRENMVFAEVIDSGLGIAEENVNKLFQHGFTTKRDGHGFGLHSCANAAGELQGKLSASSPGLGQGATFRLELPITNQDQKHESL